MASNRIQGKKQDTRAIQPALAAVIDAFTGTVGGLAGIFDPAQGGLAGAFEREDEAINREGDVLGHILRRLIVDPLVGSPESEAAKAFAAKQVAQPTAAPQLNQLAAGQADASVAAANAAAGAFNTPAGGGVSQALLQGPEQASTPAVTAQGPVGTSPYTPEVLAEQIESALDNKLNTGGTVNFLGQDIDAQAFRKGLAGFAAGAFNAIQSNQEVGPTILAGAAGGLAGRAQGEDVRIGRSDRAEGIAQAGRLGLHQIQTNADAEKAVAEARSSAARQGDLMDAAAEAFGRSVNYGPHGEITFTTPGITGPQAAFTGLPTASPTVERAGFADSEFREAELKKTKGSTTYPATFFTGDGFETGEVATPELADFINRQAKATMTVTQDKNLSKLLDTEVEQVKSGDTPNTLSETERLEWSTFFTRQGLAGKQPDLVVRVYRAWRSGQIADRYMQNIIAEGRQANQVQNAEANAASQALGGRSITGGF